jgi:4-amino-4-deoxy-L-arabinose transferase-like glycosyltransferase
MRLANVTLLGLTVVLLYRLVAKVFRPIAGLLAAVLFACYPLSIYTATTLYPQTSVSLLVVLVFTVLTWKRTHGWRGRVLTGLVLGLLVLDDPAFLFLIVVLPVVSSRTVRTYLVHFLEVTGGAAVPVAAWKVRNYVHFKELFFISTNGGYNLLLGNSPHAGADTGVSASISIYVRHASTLHGEVAQNSYYEHAAIQWVSSHPGRAGVLYILKFFNFFNSANNLATRGTGSSFEQLVLTASYLILVFLLVLRLICWRRCGYNRYSSYLLVVYVLGALVSAVVVTRVRYRGPFELFLVTAIAPLATAFYDKESPSQSDQQCLAAGDSVQG